MQWLILQVALTSLIGLVSVFGDEALQNGKTEIERAISDNITHATVGGLVWALIVALSKKSLQQNFQRIVACFLMSSLIDVDHFIAARSWDINDATHLNHRPFLHCTTIPIVLWILLTYLAKIMNLPILITYGWMILASFLSHHIRDGTRRGLWFWPFGSTPHIPYNVYLTVSMALPFFIEWLMTVQIKERNRGSSNINIV